MTLKQAKKVYLSAAPIPDVLEGDDQSWWEDVRKEMEAVVAAKSDRAAGKIIEWWGCWEPSGDTATKFARRVREAARKL